MVVVGVLGLIGLVAFFAVERWKPLPPTFPTSLKVSMKEESGDQRVTMLNFDWGYGGKRAPALALR